MATKQDLESMEEVKNGATDSEGNDVFTGEDIATRAHEEMMKKMKGRDVLAFSTTPMTTSEWLRKCLADTMRLREAPQKLPEVSFEGVARYLSGAGHCSRVITMAGAGISTSAGIPDYRSPGTGLFHTIKDEQHQTGMTDVSDMFNLEFFQKNPKPFFQRSKRFFEVTPKPTPCHYFIRLLHEKGLLLRHYTQNIDMLERMAGLPADQVMEAHGTFFTSHCATCRHTYTLQWMKDRVMKDQIPTCEKGNCKGVVRPDIVMYGELLLPRFADHVKQDFPQCDLLIILGTSLVVQPFASLISKVKVSTPRLYINLDNGGMDRNDMGVVFGGGLYFDVPGNLTDVFKQTTCDDACLELADLAGWGKELRSLIQREHKQIDQQRSKKAAPKTTTTTTMKPTTKKLTAASTFTITTTTTTKSTPPSTTKLHKK